ncbi:cutinase family protein [Rudaeicoccus suwonensis]|uniref:cutinase family protein n=1 Tax=Rudaeicoccus suwonensis TaxID=657409 RepID=UPI0014776B7B|nr:cutinase family protein [Rudaeicoccus suwonensis]
MIYIGARGSGETYNQPGSIGYLGGPVTVGLDAFASHLAGYRVGYYGIPYSADAVFPDIPFNVPKYYASIDTGINDTIAFLKARMTRCPQEHYVLAGYSQGAMVMHRVFFLIEQNKLTSTSATQLLPRLDGVLAIGDGDRVDSEGGTHYGTAKTSGSWGLSWGVLGYDGTQYKAVDARIPNLKQWPSSRFQDVCMANDAVCDFDTAYMRIPSPEWLATFGIAVHTASYRPPAVGETILEQRFAGKAVVFVAAAAINIANVTRQTPAVVTAILPPGVVGTPYSATLAAIGGRVPYVWSVGNLPPGLSLNSTTGVITGSPTTAAVASVAIMVKDHVGATASISLPLTIAQSVTWRAPQMIDPSGSPNSVSCPTSSFCVAVDAYGNALTFNGSAWSQPATVDSHSLLSVSCPTSSFCVAVDNDGNVLTYNGSAWSGASSADSDSGLNSVSCASSSFCVAMDGNGNAITYNGTTWSAPTLVDAGQDGAMLSVSCPTSLFCVAFDSNGNALTFNGTDWSTPALIDPYAAAHSAGEALSVSCPSTTFCAAVDDSGYALTYKNSTWSAPAPLDQPGTLNSISCAPSMFCANAGGTSASTLNGSEWSVPTGIDTDPNGGGLTTTSCAAANFCAAFDYAGNVLEYR